MTGDLRLVMSRSPKKTLQRDAECETDQNTAEATADSPLAIGTDALVGPLGIRGRRYSRIANAIGGFCSQVT